MTTVACGFVSKVTPTGVGPDRYNQLLSLRRAEAVRDYLMSQGIDEVRMTIAGYGESSPIDTNDTRAGRANNRAG